MAPPLLYVGLMSGTSVDGIDACLAAFDDTGGAHEHAHVHQAFPEDLRRRILELARGGGTLAEAATLDVELGTASAMAVNALLGHAGVGPSRVRAIGSHGQTVLHRPADPAPSSVQLGDPHIIALRTGIDTVADFRRADIAAGGEGAPLAPAFHASVFRAPRERRAVVNLGGIANVTRLDPDAPVIGFDTGPGNILLDAWIAHQCGRACDTDGVWSAGGRVDEPLLARMRADPWFERPPPKSTGRERFDLGWLQEHLAGLGDAVAPVDVQATLAELTAHSVAAALDAAGPTPDRLIVCGGGAHNGDLLRRLRAQLPRVRVVTSADHGIEPQHVEPMAFAWLAQRRVHELAGNLPSVTGADRPLVLGALIRAAPMDRA